jgi:glycerate 2-kinase
MDHTPILSFGGRYQRCWSLRHCSGLSSRSRTASMGTDGIDGASHAAGAFADQTTIARAEVLGLDAASALTSNDSTPFFEALDDLIVPGPTGTNVMDVQVILIPE